MQQPARNVLTGTVSPTSLIYQFAQFDGALAGVLPRLCGVCLGHPRARLAPYVRTAGRRACDNLGLVVLALVNIRRTFASIKICHKTIAKP